MIDYYITDTSVMTIVDTAPYYTIVFSKDDKKIGVLDFNGPRMTFVGDADESARVFMNYIVQSFAGRLKDERERCAKICDDADKSTHPADLADRIRMLSDTR